MEEKNQEEFAFVELIREAMNDRGWKAVDLYRESRPSWAAFLF
jgi:hypothetical protein